MLLRVDGPIKGFVPKFQQRGLGFSTGRQTRSDCVQDQESSHAFVKEENGRKPENLRTELIALWFDHEDRDSS